MREIELKLQVPTVAIAAIVDQLRQLGARGTRMRAAYFDTPDSALARQAMAWRIRREGRRWVQTLKAGQGHVRQEHEVIVPGPAQAWPPLDAARHRGSPAGKQLKAILDASADGAGERFRTEFTCFPWEQSNRVAGTTAASFPAPRLFEQRGVFRGKERSVEIAYRDGRIAELAVAPVGGDDNEREPVPLDDVAGALDPLTGIVALLLRLEAGGSCDGRYDGFDGRRRFTMELVDRGNETIEVPGARGGPGPARVCDFVYRQTAGYARRVSWGPDRQREPREGRFWIGDPRQVVPGVALTRLPLRMEVENSYGRMLAHLRPEVPR